jgi:hypothetical protein
MPQTSTKMINKTLLKKENKSADRGFSGIAVHPLAAFASQGHCTGEPKFLVTVGSKDDLATHRSGKET